MIQFFLTLRRLFRAIVRAWKGDPQFRSLTLLVAFTLLSGPFFLPRGRGVEHSGRLLLQRHDVDYRGFGGTRPSHHVGQALHDGLHLRRVGPHRGVHQHRNPGNLE